MPDVVRYVCYELLTVFLGAVAALLSISDSDFGSEHIVLAPVRALHPCICIVFLHYKYFKLKSITRIQIVSRFLHLEYT